ncbi:MAG: DUF4337 domain-containing protein [Kofleriaceae bacterium]
MPEEIEVPTDHLHEKMQEESEEHGDEKKWISRIAVSSAILAVCAAVCALLASHHSDEAILEQMKATDQWSYYQAKGIKLAILRGNIEQAEADGRPVSPERKAKIGDYEKDMKEIEEKGHELEESSEDHMKHHVKLARGVTFFQIGIAMAAIAVLARRPRLWFLSFALGIGGLIFMAWGIIA